MLDERLRFVGSGLEKLHLISYNSQVTIH